MSTTVKVSQLPAAVTPLAGVEEVMIVQSGTSRRAPASAFGSSGPVDLQTGVTGVLPVVNGGTGQSSPAIVEINSQTGTTYTLVLTDAGRCVEMNNALANTLTVPPNSSVAFPVFTTLLVRMMGAGQTSIAAGAGVTIHTPLTLNLFARYSLVSLHKRATNEWCLDGGLLAP